MKKVVLPAILLGITVMSYAQSSLREAIRGEGGISKHFITLSADQQIAFSEKNANAVLAFDPELKLILKKAEADNLGNLNYRFLQQYKGIPVEGAMYIVQTKGGKAIAMSGEVLTEASSVMKRGTAAGTAINKDAAIAAALKYVGAKEYAWQNADFEQKLKDRVSNINATYKPSASLVWFNTATNEDQAVTVSNLVLAYKIDVYALHPLSRAYYFVDAQTGKVLDKQDIIQFETVPGTANTYWSGTQTINSEKNGTSYTLRDLSKGNGVITLHGEDSSRGNDYTSTSANWTLSGKDRAALDVHYGVTATYTFYKNEFNRNSYDNNGTALTSYVNISGGSDNAYWDGSTMNYYPRTGADGGTTGIDVTGHELTHGVTQATSGLIYKNESGAMNESISDILGKSVQFYTKPNDINWQLSNDMNWIIRDMSNPNLEQQPDTYKGKYWAKGLLAALDNGGVHTNSGVGNFMFYLLVNGGTGTNDKDSAYTVAGIGLYKAYQIIYRTNAVYLTPSSKYADWRTAAISAATDLYGAKSKAVKSVKNAFYAVGIGAKATAATAATPVAQLIVMPNPVSSSTSVVKYELLSKGNAVMTITDVNNARVVQTISLGSQSSGKYTYRLTSGASLPVGNYILSISQNGTLVSKTPIIVAK